MNSTTIKFTNSSNTEFVKELRKKVKEYFETNGISMYGNCRMVLKTLFMFSLYLVPYFLMVTGV